MRRFKQISIIILTFFLIFINMQANAAAKFVTKEFSVIAEDGFNIKANLMMPNNKMQKEFNTVVLIHGLGFNSQWWEGLENELAELNYAVLSIDMRGHGESVYNKRMNKASWVNMKNSAFQKIPNDISKVITTIKEEYPKRNYFNNWTLVGVDLGANVGIIASDKMKITPKTVIMISPIIETRDVYVPTSIAHLDGVDFLAISSISDIKSQDASKYLRRFAQNNYTDYISKTNSSGMVMLKNDPDIKGIIKEWIVQYLN
ncbi:alpha/beta hydrolase [bacterium]|nr:alpha/beta hydrolase [bacterium]